MVRSRGDEELFRFQARGSVALREVGSEMTDRVLSVFDDDQALVRGTRRVWSSPGMWGAGLAALVILAGSWSLLFSGIPNVGFSFPFEPASVAADRFFAGWNDSGLGSPDAVHPAVGLTALLSFLFFGAEGAARTIGTLVFAVLAVLGMGRLAGRLGFRGPGRYLSGLVLIAGPGTALLAGDGSWLALGAAGLLPWAVRSVFLHPTDRSRSRLTHLAWILIWTLLLTAMSPVLGVVPLGVAILWRLVGGSRSSFLLGLGSLAAGLVAVNFVFDDRGWLVETDRRLGLVVSDWWPVLVAVTTIPIIFTEGRVRRLASFGAIVGLAGLLVVRLPVGGPGIDEAALILASFGAAVVVTAALDKISVEPRRLLAAVGASAILVVSIGSLLNGRLGLPEGDVNDRLSFASTLAGGGGEGRVLIVSTDQSMIPGESRPGPGFWYRLLDGGGTTIDEVWLAERRTGDRELGETIQRIASGAELRPGAALAGYSVDWVVVAGEESALDPILETQLDLTPTPLINEWRVYENPASAPLAAGDDGVTWIRDGAGFSGPVTSGRIGITVNHAAGWAPDAASDGWHLTVSGGEGSAVFAGGGYLGMAPSAAFGLFLLAIALLVVEKARR